MHADFCLINHINALSVSPVSTKYIENPWAAYVSYCYDMKWASSQQNLSTGFQRKPD